MTEENNNRIVQEETQSKAKKFWKNAGYCALAFVLALVTVTVICL